MKLTLTTLLPVFLLTACSQADVGDNPTHPVPDSAVYLEAVASELRSEADKTRDAGRQPAAVLEFIGIRPGMAVLDMFSGGGYYTEIIANVVGEDGSVLAHVNSAYLQFVGDEFEARYADDRLTNVEILMAENNELQLETGSLDAIMMALSFHDIYWVSPQNNWPKIDGPALFSELFDSLRPGGVLGIVDHFAETGAPKETGGTLHRIDPRIVITELEAAGFRLEAESDLLRNMHDDHSKNVFDPAVRGKTDRFVLKFVKPE